ncbi:DNA polymerase III, subunit gamma and tau [Candidatus Roizmanbacteria bacterium RIFCSPHIGHO2_02_FULL_40_13b]|uniref:DNA polymerase III subunit gamma/tau n=1 Tax=Candidatus Roizmanbacteria bacterium RIFCSPHIGHO2_01_FULL_39_24 TaxID=1802032 RepID=A0A1F7GE43_9BACT|nr:MAG: DNA polymerase III, subunit gamma and tau [Candidatus Roizmanbacteria bacterium RIFCSPHIGHO2_01_FULL_39_24]OGK26214.1 MAG: DNA polymerase III, subunit gamma and tau [Candidatus Roizmanbacteria bacterium RIFCSPHIGHO2_02_FULL_40_13b]OGK50366.1 MAG: DNA polymerase III, subunit gamma and tau [Candidatus Roizmanbacteria bacterium RIFCSPLOWO2_01_FULL_40_32]OGK56210.1 MAG: DNA polymerase III, subunit gamma and tau [Candidatus Roizmanbacteria bacterium RIFCSPLOWO2_02_FULL_39_8]
MYYLKYRPQTIEEIDNEDVRTRLKNVLSKKTISHSWLLTGPKGTGKTSSARILAKAINCLDNIFADKGKSEEPCNKCDNCKLITNGSAMDVIEIDGASNRKIDDVRELIDKLKFAPVHMRYKVYIIDEVHMLTSESFNALLKTLEEPPANTIFILATTELDKLPKTIISRCLRLNFSHAKKEEVLRQLGRIVKGEKLTISKDILESIAINCDFSFRDSAKLLEEVVLNSIKTKEEFFNLIGLAENKEDLLHFVQEMDVKKVLIFIENYDIAGGSFKSLTEYLLEELHANLLAQNGVGEEKTKYQFNAKQTSVLIRLITESYGKLKMSPIESLPLEMAILEYIQTQKI